MALRGISESFHPPRWLQPAAGIATAALPVLPPSLQTPVAAALLGVPLVRFFSVIARANSVSPRGRKLMPASWRRANALTGIVEREIEAPRTLGAGAAVIGSLIAGGASPFSFATLAVSAIAHLERRIRVEGGLVERGMQAGRFPTPEAWDIHEAAALGFLGTDVPPFSSTELLEGNPPPYAETAPRTLSRRPTRRVLWTTLTMTLGLARRTHSRVEGRGPTFRGWLASLRRDSHVPVTPHFLDAMDRILPFWMARAAREYGMTVRFEGFEALDQHKGTPILYATAPHTGLWHNFFVIGRRPRARMVADSDNWHRDPRARPFKWLFNVIGLPSAKRGGGVSEENFREMTDLIIDHQIEPLFYTNKGRVPRAYKDDGTLDRPGLYSNVVSKRSEYFLNFEGLMTTVIAAAKRSPTGKAIVPIVAIDESEPIAPKQQRSFPFHREVARTGGTVTFRLVDIVEVDAETQRNALRERLTDETRRAYPIDDHLRGTVIGWGNRYDRARAAGEIIERSHRDVRYLILIDRIRSLHPSLLSRRAFISDLLNLATRESPEEALTDLLGQVSVAVKKTEYVDFSPLASETGTG